ncbi:hypothetical protein DPMN_043739 [Dreissena polymorpha]|uniref:Uncharacterized protein n=1 Tax=Dreissena polymorpha TaxID=45954 RepID=A0A9D4D208_DREPO|nr:hypothetical protein DPMN_043739 [Dreissena polymorpha]
MSAVQVICRVEEEEEEIILAYEDIETIVLDTGYDNLLNFLNVWKSYDTMAEFLSRDKYISVRGTIVNGSEAEEFLQTETDIDGICIEWIDISKGMHHDFTHMYLKSRPNDIRKIYPFLKKHLDLLIFGEKSLKTLRQSVGCQIIYHGGWETWLGFIPEKDDQLLFDLSDQKRMVTAAILRIKERFEQELRNLHARRIATKTLAKNNLKDATKLFVLPGDHSSILTAFNCAVESIDLVSKFNVILLTFRFGEKSVQPVFLPIGDRTAVKDITVHVGCNITSNDFDLFWCRQGLLDIVGTRGTLTTAFSFIECANFQSNLDGRKMDVSAVVRSISRNADMRFVQLYSDLPQIYPNSRMHPVSGSIVMLRGLSNELT